MENSSGFGSHQLQLSPALRRLIEGFAEIAVDLYLAEMEGSANHPREADTQTSVGDRA